MPLHSRKRKKGSINLEKARKQIGRQRKVSHKAKTAKKEVDEEPETISDLLNLSHEAMDTDNEEEDLHLHWILV